MADERTQWFREDARNAFLSTIRAVAPNVLTDLAESALVAFAAVPAQAIREAWTWHPRAEAYRDALKTWGVRWNLEAHWLLETAHETVSEWHEFPHLAQRKEWSWRRGGWMVDESPLPPPPWSPLGDRSAEQARREIKAYSERLLKDHDARVSEAKANGLATDRPQHEPKTIKRAVRYQVLSMPFSALAREEGISRAGLTKTVRSFLRDIGLPERPRSLGSGRPKGSMGRRIAASVGRGDDLLVTAVVPERGNTG